MSAWVVNASPLILLGKIDRLPLLGNLPSQLIIPREVADEIEAGPSTDAARSWLATQGARFVVDRITLEPHIVAWDLGTGETAVLSHSLQMRDAVCVVDDRAARDCAAVFGLKVAGSLGILIRAKRAGLLNTVRPEVDALLNAGAQLSKQVVRECLKLAGEGD